MSNIAPDQNCGGLGLIFIFKIRIFLSDIWTISASKIWPPIRTFNAPVGGISKDGDAVLMANPWVAE